MNNHLIKISLFAYLLFLSCTFRADIGQDLELDALFITINHTQTDHGSKALRSILDNPIDNLPLLLNRQTAINHLINNKVLYSKLNDALKLFHSHEHNLTAMIKPTNPLEVAATKPFYFSHSYTKKWNYSPVGIELGQIAYCGNLFSSVAQHALAFALFTWGLEEEHTCAVHPDKKHTHHTHDHKHSDNHSPNAFKALISSPSFKYAFQLWHSVAQIQELYGIQSVIRNHLTLIKNIQAQLIELTHGIQSLKIIYGLVRHHPEIVFTISHYESLYNLCNNASLSKKLNALLELLETPTFKGSPSIFSRMGNILVAYKLIQEVGHELQPALDAVGEIDAYMSCAHLITKHKTSQLQYSFAHYDTDQTGPSLSAHNFWHPLLASENTQLNSLSLGKKPHETRNVILTGPNACGKSTNLKTITLCVYYAQTLTFVPAQQYEQTLYKEIYSSIIIHDDIQNSLSLFATELTQAEQLLEKVDTLKNNEYIFIALDELFTSTHHEKGQCIAMKLLTYLYECPQVITIVSTHFERLVELASKDNSHCKNYTVNRFVLEPGIGHFDNSFDLICSNITSRLLK